MSVALYVECVVTSLPLKVEAELPLHVDMLFGGHYRRLDRAAVQRVATWLAEWLRETAPRVEPRSAQRARWEERGEHPEEHCEERDDGEE